jgi:hypothetical protein
MWCVALSGSGSVLGLRVRLLWSFSVGVWRLSRNARTRSYGGLMARESCARVGYAVSRSVSEEH